MIVYAPYGRAYNNAGGWLVKYVAPPIGVAPGVAKSWWKNQAMAESADCGLMVWDGESRGTFQNIREMAHCHKPVTVYLAPAKRLYRANGPEGLEKLLAVCQK